MDYIYDVKNIPSSEIVSKLAQFSSATLHEASGKRGALPSSIKPLDDSFSLTGPAVTIELRPGDNLMLHRAIYEAREGDVLIVDAKGFSEAGIWGEIMSTASVERGIAGLVVYGSVRDKKDIIESGFPVFSSGICIKGTTKLAPGFINRPISIADVLIEPGDIVRGDCDGVVIVKYNDINCVISEAEKIIDKEKNVLKKLKEGMSTLKIYGFEALSKYDSKRHSIVQER